MSKGKRKYWVQISMRSSPHHKNQITKLLRGEKLQLHESIKPKCILTKVAQNLKIKQLKSIFIFKPVICMIFS